MRLWNGMQFWIIAPCIRSCIVHLLPKEKHVLLLSPSQTQAIYSKATLALVDPYTSLFTLRIAHYPSLTTAVLWSLLIAIQHLTTRNFALIPAGTVSPVRAHLGKYWQILYLSSHLVDSRSPYPPFLYTCSDSTVVYML
jgi:hypothetical protein